MADIITVSSSSEDEEAVVSPPRKRIKPTPVLNHLPNVTITKILNRKSKNQHVTITKLSNPKSKNQDVVVLCSDDEDEDVNKESREDLDDEEVTCIEDNPTKKNNIILTTSEKVDISVIPIYSEQDELTTRTKKKQSSSIIDQNSDFSIIQIPDEITKETSSISKEDVSPKSNGHDDDTIIQILDETTEQISNTNAIIQIPDELTEKESNTNDVLQMPDGSTEKTSNTNDIIQVPDESTKNKPSSNEEDVLPTTNITDDNIIQIPDESTQILDEPTQTPDEPTQTPGEPAMLEKSANNINNESIEINDVVDECPDNSVLLKVSCDNSSQDSEGEEGSGKENRFVDSDILETAQPGSSKTSDKTTNKDLLDKFVKIVDDQLQEETYSIVRAKFPLLWNYYKKSESDLRDSINFKNLLKINIQKAQKSQTSAVIGFNNIFEHLRDSAHADSIIVDKEHVADLKKLENMIKKLMKRIKELEDAELDFEDEENSSYLMLDRYIKRLDLVYKKYCKLLKKNPFSGRLTYAKLDFVDSEFNEINRAISKKYKDNKKFPSFFEMEKFIKTVVKDNKLDLSESKIHSESQHCFQRLGELLQNRRRKELYDIHYTIIENTDDPANQDSKLNTALKDSYTEGQVKIEKLVAEFVSKQESKKEDKSDASENESDKTDYVDSEDDEGENDDGKG